MADKTLAATPNLTPISSFESASTVTSDEVLTHGINCNPVIDVYVRQAEDDYQWTSGPVCNGTSHVNRPSGTAEMHSGGAGLKDNGAKRLDLEIHERVTGVKDIAATGGALKRRNAVVKRARNLCNFTYTAVQLNL